MNTAGISGGILAAVDSFRPSLVARSTGHQALLFGTSATLGYAVGHAARATLDVIGFRHRLITSRRSNYALFASAAAVAAPIIVHRANQERQAHADWGVPAMRPAVAAAQGTLVAAALVGTATLKVRALRAFGSAASGQLGGPPALWSAGAGVAVAGAVTAAAPVVQRKLLARLSAAGATPDPALTEAPTDPNVSGGPGTLVPYESHAREGSRLVHLATPRSAIESLTERAAKDPIRVFVGVSAAASPQERVALAVAELERLGAFERHAILAVSPAGTGYANPVPVEALEVLTGGDCATVAVQYGVLPSMFSAPLLPTAARTYRLLVDALVARGPLLFCYGESLGAQAAQAALRADPTRWRDDGAFEGIDSALFVGTPAGTGIRRLSGGRPRVLVADRWQNIPDPLPPDTRVMLLDHDADPVTRLERSLIWSRPDWLAQRPRGRGVPDAMAWRPLLTYLQVGFDVARATQPQLGRFHSHGHDYRSDLAHLVRAAYAPQASDELLAQVEERLVWSELERAELLARQE